MKNYFVLLLLIASCNGLNQSTNCKDPDQNKQGVDADSTNLNKSYNKKFVLRNISAHSLACQYLDISNENQLDLSNIIDNYVELKEKATKDFTSPNSWSKFINSLVGYYKGHISNDNLTLTIKQKNSELLQILFNNGGDVNSVNDVGDSLLIFTLEEYDENVFKTLLDHPGIDVNNRDGVYDTPLILAITANTLQGTGDSSTIQEEADREAMVIALLSHKDINPHQVGKAGQHPVILKMSREKPSVNIIKAFLDHQKVGVNYQINNEPLIYIAVDKNKKDIVSLFLSYKNININVRGRNNTTPIERAKQLACPDIYNMLLDYSEKSR